MAIKHLHHLDLNLNQLKNTKLEIAGSDPSHVSTDEGRIIYNSGSNALKFNNGTGWITLDGSGDISGITAGYGLTGGGTAGNVSIAVATTQNSGISISEDAVTITPLGITAAMLAADAVETAKIKDGNVTLAKMANLAENNFIGRKTASAGVPEALTATEVRTILNVEDGANAYGLPTASASVKGGIKVGTNLSMTGDVLSSSFTNTQLTDEEVQDIVGGMVSGNTESHITVEYADGGVGAGKLNFSVDNTVLKTTGDYTMGGALTITGNLTVNGTTTTVNSSTVSVEDNMFEMANGNTAADSLDIGWYGLYLDGSTQKYATIYREASTDTFRVGSATSAPGNTVADFTLGKFEAGEFIGDLSGNATTATTLASSRSFSITGDGSATGVSFNGSSAVALNLVLDTVNTGTLGSLGSASETVTFIANGKGLVTATAQQSIQITSSQVTSFDANAVSAVRSANSYAANIGSATLSAVTVNHALGSQDVIVQVRNVASPYEAYMVEIEYTDANNVEIKTSAALGLNAARVMVTRVG